MKKVLVTALLLTAAVVLFKVFIPGSPKNSDPKLMLVKDEKRTEETDAPLRLFRSEFKKMVDPVLGFIPYIRLRDAEDYMKSQASLNRGGQVSSLTWSERGPNNIGGRTRALLVDANDGTGNTVFAGGVGGGLWKTTNFKAGSPTWSVVNDFFANLAITCIKQNPVTPSEMYFGTGEGWGNIDAIQGAGIWKSTNGGTSWTQLGSTTGISFVQDLEFDNNGFIYAATRATPTGLRGILRSSDGGVSWTQVLTDPGVGVTTRGADLERAPDGDMYASLGIFSTGHVFRSAANGVNTGISGSWTEITPSGITTNGYQRVEIAVCPNNANRVYLVAQDDATFGIGAHYRTDNDGGAWTTLANASWCDQGALTNTDYSRGQGWYDLIMGVDPTNSNTVLSGGVVVVKTTNSGTSWTQATRWTSGATCTTAPVIHADTHEILYRSATELIICNDGGIYYSTDGGATFVNKNGGYNVTQYYGMAVHPSSGNNTMLAGAQDNGSHLFGSAGINTVSSVSGGDGGQCFIDQTNGTVWITCFPGGTYNIFRSSGTLNSQRGSGNGRFIACADYANTLNVLYCGDGDGLYGRITNVETGTTAYSTINVAAQMGANRQVSCVKVDPADETVIWLGCSDSENNTGAAVTPILLRVIRANNGTAPPATAPAATAFTGPALPAGAYISNIDIEPGNSNHMLLTVSNFGVTSVWESTNGGTTWTSVEGNLPDMPIRWAMFIPSGFTARTQAIGGVMLGTELGVWTTSTLNGGSTVWAANNSGLANVRIDQLVQRTSDHLVGAATHGRGVFTAILNAVLPVVLVDFGAAQSGQNIEVNWSTASEYNSSHFDLEKSEDGITFRKITTVQASGLSNSLLNYHYTDKEVRAERNYYRLISVDDNGEKKISNIVVVVIKGRGQQLFVKGNPVHDRITLSFFKQPENSVSLSLYDASGKKVAQRDFGKTAQQIIWDPGVASLSRGIYFLKVQSGDFRVTEKIVKE